MKKREGYTKQGVRDLNSLPAPKSKVVEIPPDCDHSKMRICCRNEKGIPCGHMEPSIKDAKGPESSNEVRSSDLRRLRFVLGSV